MTGPIQSAWRTFWFTRTRRHPLGVARAVLAGWCTARYVPEAVQIAQRDAMLDPALFHWTLGHKLLILPYPPTGAALTALTIGLYLAGALACLGLFTRLATAMLALGLLYVYSGFTSHDFFNHEQVLAFQVLLILALAPGSTAWSLDRLIALNRFKRQRNAQPLQPNHAKRLARHLQGPHAPRWGLQLILILLVVVYTTAGISKLRFSDGRWLDGQTLKYYMDSTHGREYKAHGQVFFGDTTLAEQQPWKDDAGLTDHGYGVGYHWVFRTYFKGRWFYTLLATATVLFELSAFALLLGPQIRNVYLVGAFAMHSGIGFAMGLPFDDYRLLILVLISYPVLWRQLTRPRAVLACVSRATQCVPRSGLR